MDEHAPRSSQLDDLMEVVGAVAEVQHGFVGAAQFHASGIAGMLSSATTHLRESEEQRCRLIDKLLSASAATVTQVVNGRARDEELQSALAQGSAVRSEIMERFRHFVDLGAGCSPETKSGVSAGAPPAELVAKLATEAEVAKASESRVIEQCQELVSAALGEEAQLRAQLHHARLELIATQKQLALANARREWSEAQGGYHRSELVALLSKIDSMSSEVREAEQLRAENAQLRGLVRKLERHLGISDVVAATAATATSSAVTGDRQTSGTTAATAPPAAGITLPIPRTSAAGRLLLPDRPQRPDAAMRDAAPELYALRILEHRGVTLSEVVDSWLAAAGVIETLVAEKEGAEAELAAVHRNAHRVFLSLTHEEKRRAHAEAQLTEASLRAVTSDAGKRELAALHGALARSRDEAAAATVLLHEARADAQRSRDDAERARRELAQCRADSEQTSFANTIAMLRRQYEEGIQKAAAQLERHAADAADARAEVEMLQRDIDALKRAVQATRLANEAVVADRAELEQRTSVMADKLHALQRELAEAQHDVLHAKSTVLSSKVATEAMSDEPLDGATPSSSAIMQDALALLRAIADATAAAARASQEAISQPYDAAARACDRDTWLETRRTVLGALSLVAAQGAASEKFRAALLDRGLAEAHEIDRLAVALQQRTTELHGMQARLETAERLLEKNAALVTEAATLRPLADCIANDGDGGEQSSSGIESTSAVQEHAAELAARCAALETDLADTQRRLEAREVANAQGQAALAAREQRIATLEKRLAIANVSADRREVEIARLRSAVVFASTRESSTRECFVEGDAGGAGQRDADILTSLQSLTMALCDAAERFDAVCATVAARRGSVSLANDAAAPDDRAAGSDAAAGVDKDEAKSSLRVERLSKLGEMLRQIYEQAHLVTASDPVEVSGDGETDVVAASVEADEAVERDAAEADARQQELEERVAQLEADHAAVQAELREVRAAAASDAERLEREAAEREAAARADVEARLTASASAETEKLQQALQRKNEALAKALAMLKARGGGGGGGDSGGGGDGGAAASPAIAPSAPTEPHDNRSAFVELQRGAPLAPGAMPFAGSGGPGVSAGGNSTFARNVPSAASPFSFTAADRGNALLPHFHQHHHQQQQQPQQQQSAVLSQPSQPNQHAAQQHQQLQPARSFVSVGQQPPIGSLNATRTTPPPPNFFQQQQQQQPARGAAAAAGGGGGGNARATNDGGWGDGVASNATAAAAARSAASPEGSSTGGFRARQP